MASKSAQQHEAGSIKAIEEQLDAVDSTLDRLKTLYEQYFLGIQKQAPGFIHNDVERKLRDLTQLNIRNTGLRYRLATLQQKFGSYNSYWRRTLRQIENGTYVRNLAKIGREAARNGADIPEEILAAMPKRMREQVLRDRDAAIAIAKRRKQVEDDAALGDGGLLELADEPLLPDADEAPAMISEPSVLKRELKTRDGAHVLSEDDADLDFDAFFSAFEDDAPKAPSASGSMPAASRAASSGSMPASSASGSMPAASASGSMPAASRPASSGAWPADPASSSGAWPASTSASRPGMPAARLRADTEPDGGLDLDAGEPDAPAMQARPPGGARPTSPGIAPAGRSSSPAIPPATRPSSPGMPPAATRPSSPGIPAVTPPARPSSPGIPPVTPPTRPSSPGMPAMPPAAARPSSPAIPAPPGTGPRPGAQAPGVPRPVGAQPSGPMRAATPAAGAPVTQALPRDAMGSTSAIPRDTQPMPRDAMGTTSAIPRDTQPMPRTASTSSGPTQAIPRDALASTQAIPRDTQEMPRDPMSSTSAIPRTQAIPRTATTSSGPTQAIPRDAIGSTQAIPRDTQPMPRTASTSTGPTQAIPRDATGSTQAIPRDTQPMPRDPTGSTSAIPRPVGAPPSGPAGAVPRPAAAHAGEGGAVPPNLRTQPIPRVAPSQASRPNPIAPGAASRTGSIDVESMNGPFPRAPSDERPASATPPSPPPSSAAAATAASAAAARAAAAQRAAQAGSAAAKPPGAAAAKPAAPLKPPPGMTEADVNALHAKYIKAKEMVGEKVDPGSREKLLKTINQTAPKIMEQYKASGVDFSVVVKDNQVVIKAKPKT